jgi:hypothetical protein
MLAKLGDLNAAAALLTEQINRTEQKGHAAYVRELARKLGIGELTTAIADKTPENIL